MTLREVEKLKAVPAYHTKVGGELGKTGLPLDRWIGYAVKVLRDAGFETYESCQGGRGHCFSKPTVRFGGTFTEGLQAVAVALNHGLPVFEVRRFWSIRDGEITGPNWEIVFHPISKLKKCQRRAERAGLLGALTKRSPQSGV